MPQGNSQWGSHIGLVEAHPVPSPGCRFPRREAQAETRIVVGFQGCGFQILPRKSSAALTLLKVRIDPTYVAFRLRVS